MRVSIDQDLCSGVGLCASACPEVFAIGDDGRAVVRGGQWVAGSGSTIAAELPDSLVEGVLDAAEGCPERCIYVE